MKYIKGKKKYYGVLIQPYLQTSFATFGITDLQWSYNHSAPPESVFFFHFKSINDYPMFFVVFSDWVKFLQMM
jgi:hypothetical protein